MKEETIIPKRFVDKLSDATARNNSLLCIGLDPDPAQMAEREVFAFNKAIIDATSDLVCVYKPNMAFYEAQGLEALRALMQTVEYVHAKNIAIIGDAKWGDVGNTMVAYAKAAFDVFGFDAVTVNPYPGYDALEPFLRYEDRGILVWCRSSNPGAAEFQDLLSQGQDGEPHPLYEVIALRARDWNRQGNVGLVVGATYLEEIERIRELCPDMLLLIPGVGAQGGDLEKAVRYGADAKGGGIIINSSRQVLYASKGHDYALAAREVARQLRDQINSARTAQPA